MNLKNIEPAPSRRSFLANMTRLGIGSLVLSSPFAVGATAKSWTVGEIMDLFIKEVKGSPFGNTVDTLKAGSRDNQVKGIVTTMFATIPVIEEAKKLGANFIIAHEPTFYNHLDKTDWLSNDQVFQHKMKLLNDNGISVWRNHDYIHSHEPDGVFRGVLDKLGWRKYTNDAAPWNVEIPSTSLGDLIKTVKDKLNISQVRFIGEKDHSCTKVLLMPGAAGGERQIKAISQHQPDVVLVGELQEWETAEYIRDARAAGKKMALVVMGHTDSEDGGSIFMRDWLKQHVPDIKVTHIHSGNPFKFA